MASEFVNQLLGKMTLKEKIGQMIQIHPYIYDHIKGNNSSTVFMTGPTGDLAFTTEDLYNMGSILTVQNPKQVRAIQKEYVDNHRLGIPLLFMYDIIHGYKTIFSH